jgi:hypothetical protein
MRKAVSDLDCVDETAYVSDRQVSKFRSRLPIRSSERAAVRLRATRFGGQPSSESNSLACQPKLAEGERRLAERVGFEPTVEFPLHTLSKRHGRL